MSSETPSTSPRYMGGQAVVEGVMMRGEHQWAVAARLPTGEITVDIHDVPGWGDRWAKVPMVRGVVNLAESMGLGMRALTWSANLQMPEEERLSGKAMGFTVAVSMALFLGIFILLPALGARGIGGALGLDGVAFHALEGAMVLGIFLGYLLLIGRMKEIRKVFQYHGAEHKAIAAYENDVPLTAESAQRFTTAHVRCGTNFLLMVLTMAIVVYSLIGRPALPYLILSRIILIPIIAGAAYELIRLAAKNMDKRWVQKAMVPGLTLQKLTTREPTLDQLEVAITALRAVFTSEQTEEVDARIAA
jgi:uncharacterized protein YqhQ